MDDSRDRIKLLAAKIEALSLQHEKMRNEINELLREVANIKSLDDLTTQKEIEPAIEPNSIPTANTIPAKAALGESISDAVHQASAAVPTAAPKPAMSSESFREQLNSAKKANQLAMEKFIGENLINKIGILITIIGVGIGTKYAIDHQLISPLTRIILGYLAGLCLAGFSLKLKEEYKSFSAVLLSGSMAIMYFVTFSAYSFYDLIPQVPAFLLMVLFTVITVKAALDYDIQVIAHIGLVGAYAVPFLLSDNSGRVHILFSYMTIINCGILFIALKRRWKPLFFSSFLLSWLIYVSWYSNSYDAFRHFTIGLVFLAVFFGLFFTAFITYLLVKKERQAADVFAALLLNGVLFFGIGYSILNDSASGTHYTGLFTLISGCIWLMVWSILRMRKEEVPPLDFFLQTIGWILLTTSVSVQLNGPQVTIIWAAEAAIMYWIGIAKKNKFFEFFSYPLMIVIFCSLIHDWSRTYAPATALGDPEHIIPFFNLTFFTSLLVSAGFIFITLLRQRTGTTHVDEVSKELQSILKPVLPLMLIIVLYFTFELELSEYVRQIYMNSRISIMSGESNNIPDTTYNQNIRDLGTMWIFNYTLFFLTALAQFAGKKFRNTNARLAAFWLNMVTITVFLLIGLYDLSILRRTYLHSGLYDRVSAGLINIYIRYISLFFFGLLGWKTYALLRGEVFWPGIKNRLESTAYIVGIWLLTSELIHWFDLLGSTNLYKLGVSILWGVCSLLLIILGIRNSKRHLRMMAMVLFGVTLIKLFFYDIAEMDTILKTILFISLGVLLLIISFLYNKYKYLITEE